MSEPKILTPEERAKALIAECAKSGRVLSKFGTNDEIIEAAIEMLVARAIREAVAEEGWRQAKTDSEAILAITAAAHAEARKAAFEECKPYMGHKAGCGVHFLDPNKKSRKPCTCGFDDKIVELDS